MVSLLLSLQYFNYRSKEHIRTMFGFIGMVLMVAISLTSESEGLNFPGLRIAKEIAERSEVSDMMESMLDNYDYLEDCHDRLSWSMNMTACEQLAGGLIGLKDFLFTAVEDALEISNEAEDLKTEFAACSTESIIKQIKCYTSVISAAQALGKEVKADAEEFVQDGEDVVQLIEVNFANCFDKGLSSKMFETKMRQCKLKLKAKSN